MKDQKSKIFCTGKIATRSDLTPLLEQGLEVDICEEALSADQLIGKLQGCAGLIHGSDGFLDRAILSACPDLRAIAILATGYKSFVDASAARELGIRISNTPGANSNAVAELLVLQLLALKRRLLSNINSSESQSTKKESEILESVVGIIGMGAIGKRVATILTKGFGATVLYNSRSRNPEIEETLNISFLSLNELLSTAGNVILCAAETGDTNDLLGEAEFNRMRQETLLVSISRSSLISSAALLQGLQSGKLAAAAMDNFYAKTDPNYSALREFTPERLLVTPHIGYRTADACRRMAQIAVEAISVMVQGREHMTTVS